MPTALKIAADCSRRTPVVRSMRRSDQPSRPSATIWWCLSSATTLLLREGTPHCSPGQRPGPLLDMAGFQLSIHGRFGCPPMLTAVVSADAVGTLRLRQVQGSDDRVPADAQEIRWRIAVSDRTTLEGLTQFPVTSPRAWQQTIGTTGDVESDMREGRFCATHCSGPPVTR
jgi:hypothetical protein